jgi:hypothetical protein
VLLIALLFATICVAIAAVSWEVLHENREVQAKTALMNAGALLVMNPDGSSVGTINLSTIQDKSVLREVFPLTANLWELQALDANNVPLEQSELELIGGMRSLVSLSLKATEIGDEDLAYIASLTSLESLHLNDTAVSDAGLGNLSALQSLKVLDLSHTQVKNDLAALSRLGSLEWLVLGNLSLTDSALADLGDAPKLKRLTLRGSSYSDSALEQLTAKRPELRIDK